MEHVMGHAIVRAMLPLCVFVLQASCPRVLQHFSVAAQATHTQDYGNPATVHETNARPAQTAGCGERARLQSRCHPDGATVRLCPPASPSASPFVRPSARPPARPSQTSRRSFREQILAWVDTGALAWWCACRVACDVACCAASCAA